jgi:alpha-tubulin suppressor-like RCC1 family protein
MPAHTTETSASTTLRSRVAALLATLLVAGAVSLTPAGSPETASAAVAPTSEAVSAISMEAGGNATCTIRTDRTLWCWGELVVSEFVLLLDTGNLGENGKNEPQQIGTNLWLSVSVGQDNVCGIVIPTTTSTSGALYCFGSNKFGQLGLGTTARYSSTPVQLGGATDWTSVSVGVDNLCAIRLNSLFCIGKNSVGQFGITSGSESYRQLTESPLGSGATQAITMGSEHSCFLTKSDDSALDGVAFCAGHNSYGSLGDGTTTNSSDWVPVAGSHKFRSITAAYNYTCGIAAYNTTPLSNAGKVLCWGNNVDGQFGAGLGDPESEPEPVVIDATKTFTSLHTSYMHTCGVTTSGELYCWGANGSSQAGEPSASAAQSIIHRIGTATNWAEVTTGDSHSCARTTSTRTVASATYCWGWRQYIGNGQATFFNTPTKMPGTNWLSMSTGNSTRCGIQGVALPGKLICFGENFNGEVGNNSTNEQRTYFDVPMASGWREAAVGGSHTCGINGLGALYCWGGNVDGQLGLGNNVQYLVPHRVGAASDWSNLSAGDGFTCAVRGGTSVYCWGENFAGQVGNGDLTGAAVSTPSEVFEAADGFTWKKVSVGAEYACALATTGALFCWGENGGGFGLGGGQLGDGTLDDRFEPVASVSGMRFIDVSAGISSTCGIAVGGGTWCWGSNMYGALGNGNALPDYLFDFLEGVNSAYAGGSAVAVSTGFWSGCAIRRGGDLYCWGLAFGGTIPVGRDQSSPNPAKVGGGYTKVSNGNNFFGNGGGCGIKADTTLWCWGFTSANNFQNGFVDEHSTPQLVKVLYRKPAATGGAQFTGRAKKNSVLTADAPDFSGTPIPAVTYQWYRCTTAAAAATSTVPRTCTKITSATRSTYTLKSTEVNRYVRLLITAKNKGGTVTILTASSAKVAN